MGLPLRQNLDIRQGETWSFQFTVRDAAGVAIDLTGYSARMGIAQDRCSLSPSYLSTVVGEATAGVIVLGGAAGTVALSMTAAQTLGMDEADWFYGFQREACSSSSLLQLLYDVNLTSPLGVATRVMEGQITFYRSISRAS